MLTTSEKIFIELCNDNGISCDKIIETTHKTPDFNVSIGRYPMIVEVKELENSKEELNILSEFSLGKQVSIKSIPGKKVRSKIKDASKQLRRYKNQKIPCIIFIYSNLSLIFGEPFSPYNLKVGMYGFETLSFNNVTKSSTSSYFGKNKKLTDKMNTTISGILVFDCNSINQEYIYYHNTFAKNKIKEGLIKTYFGNCSEYKLDISNTSKLDDWIKI